MPPFDQVPLKSVGVALVAYDADHVLDELAALFHRPFWQRDAACIEHPEVNFHPARHEDTRPAKAVCAGCLVRDECLAFALEHESGAARGQGIWGGTSAKQRKTLARAPAWTERTCSECRKPFQALKSSRSERCRRCTKKLWMREHRAQERSPAA